MFPVCSLPYRSENEVHSHGSPYAESCDKAASAVGPDVLCHQLHLPSATHSIRNSDICFKGHFITKIFHPNVSPSNGEICVNALKRDWQSKYGIGHILTVIKCLLINPNPDSALDEEAGKMVQDNWTAFEKRAKLMTGIHASQVRVASIS